jgi:hypothetical protein
MDDTQVIQGSELTEEMLLELTDCLNLDEIEVISLRSKGVNTCIDLLSNCPKLQIAYL